MLDVRQGYPFPGASLGVGGVNVLEGLYVCPFGQQTIYSLTGVSFHLQAVEDFHPPYRLYLGDARSEIVLRNLTFDGKTISRSHFAGLLGQGEPAIGGGIFGAQLLPFWGPPCPRDGRVTLEVENRSCATIHLDATLLATPASKAKLDMGSEVPAKPTDSGYWR